MGRGRTGTGYTRKAHVTIKVEKVNFDELIAKSKKMSEKFKWTKAKKIAEKAKAEENTKLVIEKV